MEEKMMILKMLQEGKLTAEEAAKLLDAIDRGKSSGPEVNTNDDNRRNNYKFDEKMNKIGEKATKFAEQFSEKATKFAEQFTENVNNNAGKFGGNAERFAGDFSKRMETVGNDIAESAVKFADRLVTQFNVMFDINNDKCRFTNNYVYPVNGTPNINLSTNNFSVKLNPSDSQNIVLNMFVNSDMQDMRIDEFFKAEIDGDNYSFTTQFPGRTWGKVELMVPKTLGNINISTDNGKCELSDITFDSIKCRTSNARVAYYNCQGKTVETITNNAKVTLDNLTARNSVVRTSNGKIELDNCRLDTLDAVTSNGSIQMSAIGKLETAEGNYNLNTSNGKIDIELEGKEDCGFVVDAYTSLGGIYIELPEMSYSVDKKSSNLQSTAQVKSTNFESAGQKITIKAITSNASISIEGKK